MHGQGDLAHGAHGLSPKQQSPQQQDELKALRDLEAAAIYRTDLIREQLSNKDDMATAQAPTNCCYPVRKSYSQPGKRNDVDTTTFTTVGPLTTTLSHPQVVMMSSQPSTPAIKMLVDDRRGVGSDNMQVTAELGFHTPGSSFAAAGCGVRGDHEGVVDVSGGGNGPQQLQPSTLKDLEVFFPIRIMLSQCN